MILITTNEDDDHLNEAVSRAGRCFSKVQFPYLNKQEAQKWIETRNPGIEMPKIHKDMSLADLYAGNFVDNTTSKPKAGFTA